VDEVHELWKANPLADWSDEQCWSYIEERDLPVNPLHKQGYSSIGCTHARFRARTRGALGGSGKVECGLHVHAVHSGRSSTEPAQKRRCRLRRRRSGIERIRPLVHRPLGRGQDDRRSLVAGELEERGLTVDVLDGDVIRTQPLEGPRFLEGGPRHEHRAHRLGRLAARRSGAAVIVSAISPYEETRAGRVRSSRSMPRFRDLRRDVARGLCCA